MHLANRKLLQRKLQELFPPARGVSGQTVRISGKGTEVVDRTYTDYPQIEPLHHAVQYIAGRMNATDMVNVNDYFEPQQQWSKSEDGTLIQHGQWIVSLNSDLLPVGNFVVRCLLKRIELRIDPITKYRRMCSQALSAIGPKYQAQFTEFDKASRNDSDQRENCDSVKDWSSESLTRCMCCGNSALCGCTSSTRPKLVRS